MTTQDFYTNTEEKIVDIRFQLRDYLFNEGKNLQSLIIGLSGGIDSALVAALCYPVAVELNIKLLGYVLPILTNKEDETRRGVLTGIHFTTNGGELINLENIYLAKRSDPAYNATSDPIRNGNLKARTRMEYLYDQASLNKGCVLSTDNFSEYMLGFWSLHGDVGDISPIQMYYKTEVYEMAGYILENEDLNIDSRQVLYDTINATPTDGLGITNSDLDQLGAPSYEIVDIILHGGPTDPLALKYPKVWERVNNTRFKRDNPHYFARLGHSR